MHILLTKYDFSKLSYYLTFNVIYP